MSKLTWRQGLFYPLLSPIINIANFQALVKRAVQSPSPVQIAWKQMSFKLCSRFLIAAVMLFP